MPTVTVRSREEVIADLIMQRYPKLMDNLGKHMNGELDLPPDVEAQVKDNMEAEIEINKIYQAAKLEGISERRLDMGHKASVCPMKDKMRIMELCFPIIACYDLAVYQKYMVMDLANCLMLEMELVIKDYKQWWKKHHKHKNFPDAIAQNTVRDIIKHTRNNS